MSAHFNANYPKDFHWDPSINSKGSDSYALNPLSKENITEENLEDKVNKLGQKKLSPTSQLEQSTEKSFTPRSYSSKNSFSEEVAKETWYKMLDLGIESDEAIPEQPGTPSYSKAQSLKSKEFLKPKEKKELIKNYEQADALGHPHASFQLAEFYNQQYDSDKSIEWYRVAVKKGSVHAALPLAQELEKKEVLTSEEKQEIINLYQRAHEAGQTGAAYKLGEFYRFALQDLDRALEWYQKANDNNDAHGAFALFQAYHAMPGKETEAIDMYKRAHMLGNPQTKESLLMKLSPEHIVKHRNIAEAIQKIVPEQFQKLFLIAPGTQPYQLIKRLLKRDIFTINDLHEWGANPKLDKYRLIQTLKKIGNLWKVHKEGISLAWDGTRATAIGSYEFLMEGKDVYFKEGTFIDKGSTKTVTQAYKLKKLSDYVWATISPSQNDLARISAKLKKEREMLLRLHEKNVPNIVEPYSGQYVNPTSSTITMVQKKYERGNELFATPGHFDEKLQIVIDVTKALSVLHDELEIAHCDIKPNNIFYERDQNGKVHGKLGDFGGATELKLGKDISLPAFTQGYAPPEFFKGRTYASKPFDNYNLGVTLLQAITGSFLCINGNELSVWGILDSEVRLEQYLNMLTEFLNANDSGKARKLEGIRRYLSQAQSPAMQETLQIFEHLAKSKFTPQQNNQVLALFKVIQGLMKTNAFKRMPMHETHEALVRISQGM